MSRDDYEDDERHVRAEVRRFKQHLLTYGIVVGMLFLINLMTGGDLWFLWIAFFWGIGIAFQASRLFSDDIGREWEDRTVARIMERRHGKPYTPPPPPSAPSGPSSGRTPRRPMRPEPVSDYVPPATAPGAPAEPKAEPPEKTEDPPKEPPASGS